MRVSTTSYMVRGGVNLVFVLPSRRCLQNRKDLEGLVFTLDDVGRVVGLVDGVLLHTALGIDAHKVTSNSESAGTPNKVRARMAEIADASSFGSPQPLPWQVFHNTAGGIKVLTQKPQFLNKSSNFQTTFLYTGNNHYHPFADAGGREWAAEVMALEQIVFNQSDARVASPDLVRVSH